MRLTPTTFPDSYLIDLEVHSDERGFFARMFCANELRERGLAAQFVQVNDSFSRAARTLRGMHYQLPPRAETKLVRCIAGIIWDVMLDLRTDSPTFGHWFGAELSAANRRMMYIPKGFAHGFITLADDCEVLYLVDEFYAPDHERGVRWDDPRFAIEWPATPTVISTRDQQHPDFDPGHHLAQHAPADGRR